MRLGDGFPDSKGAAIAYRKVRNVFAHSTDSKRSHQPSSAFSNQNDGIAVAGQRLIVGKQAQRLQ
jgi:hypothetical protein